MKVFTGHFGHEANTFASHPTTYEAYCSKGALIGEEILIKHRGTPSWIGGIMQAAEEDGVELIPSFALTSANPILTRECVEGVLSHVLPLLEAHKHEVDGICFIVHGAGVSEDTDDLESYVFEKFREIVGPDIPIASALDLHGNLSQRMLELSDALVGIKQYPHIDKFEAGYLAMKTLARIIRGESKPRMALCRLPMLLSLNASCTFDPPFPEINAYLKRYTQEHGLIDATFFHGFPYADIPDSTASVLVLGEGDVDKAAREIASYIWDRRRCFQAPTMTVAEALDQAQAFVGEGYVVINEASDNPGAGCPGDGTYLLGEMLKRNLPGSIFGYMYDPEAVDEIFRHAPGDRIDLTLGGKTEPIHGRPLEIRGAEICSLSDGNFIHTSPNRFGLPARLGRCARIRVGNVEIVVASVLTQTFDDGPFRVTGADLGQYRYVALKSSQHFRAYFDKRAAAIFPADPPGLCCSNLHNFAFRNIPRPVFPLDGEVHFAAVPLNG